MEFIQSIMRLMKPRPVFTWKDSNGLISKVSMERKKLRLKISLIDKLKSESIALMILKEHLKFHSTTHFWSKTKPYQRLKSTLQITRNR